MVPDVGFGTWIVLVRFAAADRAAVQAAADRAGGEGGFALVLDGHSGSALQAVAPIDVEGGHARPGLGGAHGCPAHARVR